MMLTTTEYENLRLAAGRALYALRAAACAIERGQIDATRNEVLAAEGEVIALVAWIEGGFKAKKA